MRRLVDCAGAVFSWTVVAAFLAGCGSAYKPVKPEKLMPDSFRGAVPGVVDGPSAQGIMTGELSYRHFFVDQQLQSLIDTALENNVDLLTAIKNIESAKQTLGATSLAFLPSLTASVQDTRNTSSANGVQRTPREYTASFQASWELDVWGKIRSKRRSALASYMRTTEAAAAVRTRLVADLASGYYNLVMLDEQRAVTRNNLELADKTLEMIRLQFEAGQVTGLALRQQEAVRHAIAGSLAFIEQNIVLQENALCILCGIMPAPIKRNSALLTGNQHPAVVPGVPASLLRNRPDIRAAEFALTGAAADVEDAGAAFYPSFTITAQGGASSLRLSDWFKLPGSLFSMVQGSVVQPVFQRGALQANYRQSVIKRDQAELAFKQAVVKAVAEVSDALVRIEKLKEQERSAAERVDTLHHAVDNADMLFTAGMATYLEVMSVQSAALAAELSLADIRRQHLTALAELYRALGGGVR